MKLSQITIDPSLQMRVKMDEAVIDDYCQALLDGAKFPPIILFYDGKNYYIGDGWNRYFAHKKAGFELIGAEVRNGTYKDAFTFALGEANDKNGQRFTVADKRKAVMKALNYEEFATISDREIARICKVSNTFVSNVRKEIGKTRDVITTIQNGKEVAMRNTKDQFKKEEEIHEPEETAEDTVITELSHTVQELAEENKKLEARVAVAAMDATDEEKASAAQIISDLQEQVKILEADNRVLKASRDSFQAEASEAKKQALYGKRRYEKAEKDLADAVKKITELQRKLDLAEADLAMR